MTALSRYLPFTSKTLAFASKPAESVEDRGTSNLRGGRAESKSSQSSAMRNATTAQQLTPAWAGVRQLQASPSGRLDCPCLALNETELDSANYYDKDSGFNLRLPQGTFEYPANYGLEGCQSYDQDLAPYCDKDDFPGNPDWCVKAFCYVDKDNCGVDHFPSSFFEGLTYSYKTCGNSNSFIDMINDMKNGTRPSMMEVVAVTERELVSIKQGAEENYAEIEQFSKNQQNVNQVCTYTDSCGPIPEGRENECWGGTVDFSDTTVVLDDQQRQQASKQDLNTFYCLSRNLETTMLNAADAQHDDKNRTGYIFFGHQDTGALIQNPGLEVCPETYDARFRPWYAAAVSGPKDVVAVIDVSGSMDGNRIKLARQAAAAVVDTLTWADRVTLITFNDGIASRFSPDRDLVAGTEENIEKMKAWILDKFTPGGGTNFMQPLEEAYKILAKNKDANDQESCAQAILFLTDGDANFDKERMNEMIQSNEDVVIFSYGLGLDAKKSALQQMACMTGGLFHPVNHEGSLARMMSSYYEYYAGLQDTGKISWIKYQDAFSGSEMISGCSAVYNYDPKGIMQPDLVGVGCMDLNIIVDPETLKTCNNNAYDRFIEQIFREATQCSSKGGKITDQCTLQNMRANISRDSICEGELEPSTCQLRPQPNASDFSGLSPDRFRYIPLEGCVKQEPACAVSAGKGPGKAGSGSSSNIPMYGGIAGGGALLLIGLGCFIRRKMRRSEPEINVRPTQQYQENPAPFAPGFDNTGLPKPIPAPRPSAPIAYR